MSTISNERLEEITNDKMINQGSEFAKMASELLALRKERERAEPVYQMLTGGGWFDISKEHYEGADKTRGVVFRVVYTAPPAPPAPVVPDLERLKEIYSIFCTPTTGSDNALSAIHNACRAAMLNQAQPIAETDTTAQQFESLAFKSVVPEGWKLVPMRLTAENGAKGALSGEFSETKFVNCPECFGDDECETCDGSGRIEITVPVTWTTIKDIWAKGVEHFATSPQSPGNDHATVSGRWIPCSERMPPENTGVLVTTEFDGPGDWRMKWGTRVPGHPDAKSGWFIPGASWTPSHWQPLPEPPSK
ncbi:DUF551 domain-containing protein [Cronobacter sakazakii]|uniref:DUF551 domain-containing protein n=1 Tax=Cronobacter sakazakii TaxID=28141 RepID=UPI001FAF0049|nr:DUF551 domain-containing protein [Cronobacter sakazakii]